MISNLAERILAADRNSRALQVSGFVRFATLVLQGILLVKLGLDPVVVAVVESFYFLFNLSRFHLLSGAKFAGFARLKDEEGHFPVIFWGFTLLGVLAASVAGILMIFGRGDFESFLTLEYVNWALPLMVFFSLPADSYDLYYLEENKPGRVVGYTLLVSVIQTAGLVYLMTGGYHMGHVVLYFLCVFVIRFIHLLTKSFSKPGMTKQAWLFAVFAFPLVLHSLFSGLTDYVDGWLIKAFFEDADFAIYRYGARELPLNSILISGVLSGLIMVKADIGKTMQKEMIKLLKLLTPLMAVLILISPVLFEWFYDADYRLSALYFNIYALLMLSHVFFVQVYFYRGGDRWLLSIISVFEVLINLGLSLLFLMLFGIIGIPLATLVTDFLFRIIMMLLVKRKYKLAIGEYYPVKAHISSMLILFVCFYISYMLYF